MSLFAQLAIALALFAAGLASGIKIHAGMDAQRELVEAQVRASDAKRQIRVIDQAAGQHAATVAALSNQLGNAREKIALLSGRECLDAGTVGMLNDIGGEPMRAPAGHPAGAPAAPATGGDVRFATERDTAGAISICRARYTEVSSQLNKILDIEDARHPAEK